MDIKRGIDAAVKTVVAELKRQSNPTRERNEIVQVALQNAASVASLMLTTEALIAEEPKE